MYIGIAVRFLLELSSIVCVTAMIPVQEGPRWIYLAYAEVRSLGVPEDQRRVPDWSDENVIITQKLERSHLIDGVKRTHIDSEATILTTPKTNRQ